METPFKMLVRRSRQTPDTPETYMIMTWMMDMAWVSG